MRDFRDAKAMAQTLREALTAKSISFSHSESLELVARMLGFHDWNVLAARIQSDGAQSGPPPNKAGDAGEPAREEVAIDVAILDGYVGFYQLDDGVVFTVTRDQKHLVTRMPGQRSVPIYARTATDFFARMIDAQISFVTDAQGRATSLVLHQRGGHHPMQRIDAVAAQEIAGKVAERMKSQSANPGTEAALRRLIDGLTSGKPDYQEMTASLAEATRSQLPDLHSGHQELGAVQSVRFLGVGHHGDDVYTVRHAHGASHWRIGLDANGKISMAWVSPGP